MRRCMIAGLAAIGLQFVVAAAPPGPADAAAEINRLQAASVEAYERSGWADAEAFARQAVALSEQTFGADHPEYADSLSNLAASLRAQGRFAEAGPHYERAYAIHEAVNGLQSLDTLTSLNNLAVYYASAGRVDEAVRRLETVFLAYQAILGAEHPDTLRASDNLARLYEQLGQASDGRPLTVGRLAEMEARLGPDHPDTVRALANLAAMTEQGGDYRQAAQLYERAIAATERAHGPEHPNTLIVLNNFAFLLDRMDRVAEAEALYVRVLSVRERTLGFDHEDVVLTLNNLAGLYLRTGRRAEAAVMFTRVLEVREARSGLADRDTLIALNNLAGAMMDLDQLERAEELFERGLFAARSALGETDELTVTMLNSLARIYDRTGRMRAAARHYALVLQAREDRLGPRHPETLETLHNLGVHHLRASLPDYAVGFFESAIEGRTIVSGETHEATLSSIVGLAFARYDLGDLPGALDLAEQAASGFAARIRTDLIDASHSESEFDERVRDGGVFRIHLDFAMQGHASGLDIDVPGVFLSAQAARRSAAAAALGASAARFAAPSASAQELARQRQDLVGELRRTESQLIAAVVNGDAAGADELRRAFDGTQASLTEIRVELAESFPDFASITAPRLAPLHEVQGDDGLLAHDEALVLFSPGVLTVNAILVTRETAAFVPLGITVETLESEIADLRAGLELTGVTSRDELPDFDIERAHRLHEVLFAPLQEHLDAIGQVIVVADGALESLPLHVLVASPPDEALTGDAAYQGTTWLSDRYAITYAPSVASLRSLRRNAGGSGGQQPFIGFADPTLHATSDSRLSPDLNELLTMNGGFVAGGVCNLRPLPATAAMARSMATALGGGADTVWVGAEASEARISALNAEGRLADARVIAFATHGLVAGDLPGSGLAEPALALTPQWRCQGEPPAEIPSDGDGLLTASEVSALSLDADWVLLTACNTASSDGALNARPLSGLARAFFYAGARSLLVSHWAADEEATRRLVEALFADDMAAMSRAARLSEAMADLRSQADFAHPALWAPFVVLGSSES